MTKPLLQGAILNSIEACMNCSRKVVSILVNWARIMYAMLNMIPPLHIPQILVTFHCGPGHAVQEDSRLTRRPTWPRVPSPGRASASK